MKEIDLHKVFFSGDRQEQLLDSLEFRKTLFRRMSEAKKIKAHYNRVCLHHSYHKDYNKYCAGNLSADKLLKKWQLKIIWTPWVNFENQFGTGKPPYSISRILWNHNVRGYVLWEEGIPYILFDEPSEISIEGKTNINLTHLENYYFHKIIGKSMNYMIAHRGKTRRAIEFSILKGANIIFGKECKMSEIKLLEMPYFYRRIKELCEKVCGKGEDCENRTSYKCEEICTRLRLLSRNPPESVTVSSLEYKNNISTLPAGDKKSICEYIKKLDLANLQNAETLRKIVTRFIQEIPANKVTAILVSINK